MEPLLGTLNPFTTIALSRSVTMPFLGPQYPIQVIDMMQRDQEITNDTTNGILEFTSTVQIPVHYITDFKKGEGAMLKYVFFYVCLPISPSILD